MRASRLWAAVWTGASLSVLESLVLIIQVHTSTNRNVRSSPVAVFSDDVLVQPTTTKTMASNPRVRRAVQREEVVEVRDGGATEKKERSPAATAKMTTAATEKRMAERGGIGVGVDVDVGVASGDKEETTPKSKPKYRMVSREQARAAREKRERQHEQQRQQLHQQKDDGPPRFSYAFLIGGVHEDNPGYRGFLYNVMIATRILRDHNSTADVNLMIQFAHQSKWVAIPEDKAVRSMSINIVYLKRPNAPLSFADIQLQKFKILQWTQYDRVLFLDADIMPNKSLDYLFHMSMEGILKENVVVATRGEPANGGFWMVKPQRGDVEKMEVILRKHAEPFDRVIGWGHSFAKEKDKWESTTPRWMPRWRFWAAHLDQGLLYYWVKYHKKRVTLIVGERVQNWDQLANGTLVMESEEVRLLDAYTQPEPEYERKLVPFGMDFLREAPYRDYVHFVGQLKPWLGDLPIRSYDRASRQKTHRQLWFHTFSLLNDELKLGFNFSNWDEEKKTLEQPPLGLSDATNINEGRFTTLQISDDDT